MKSFADNYDVEISAILRDLSMYRALTTEQLMRLYPGKERKVEKLLPYLRNQCRIWKTGDYYCSSPDAAEHIDQSLLAAVWVLIDFIEMATYHSVAEFPAKIMFYVEDTTEEQSEGEIYEIVYAGIGREALVSYLASTQSQSRTNHLILVDKPEQILELNIPDTCGYCTVSPSGEVEYYQKE